MLRLLTDIRVSYCAPFLFVQYCVLYADSDFIILPGYVDFTANDVVSDMALLIFIWLIDYDNNMVFIIKCLIVSSAMYK